MKLFEYAGIHFNLDQCLKVDFGYQYLIITFPGNSNVTINRHDDCYQKVLEYLKSKII